MITKGYIVGKSEVKNKFKVKLPIFDTPGLNINQKLNSTILDATICYNPGAYPEYKVNDIVYVGFEDNDLSRPVILGMLYLEDKTSQSRIDCSNLQVYNKAIMPKDSSLSNIKISDINNLFGKVDFIYNQLKEKNILETKED